MLLFFSAFRFPDYQFSILNIIERQFQHLTYSHPTPGHEFKDQSISNFGCSENNLIHSFFFNDIPTNGNFRPEQFTHHRHIAGVLKIQIKVVCQEIEKRGKMGKSHPFGLWFSAFGNAVQVLQDLIR